MRKFLYLSASGAAMMLLILNAEASTAAAAQAVEICIRTVIPGLFPFFVLSGYLTRYISGGRWIPPLFRMQENCSGVILTGLLCGYPVGAKAAAEARKSGQISEHQAQRLLYFCSQAGPSFLFGIVAAKFDNLQFAWILWFIQIASALTVAHLIPVSDTSVKLEHISVTYSDNPMYSALKAMGAVCGWVIIFSVIIRFLKDWVLWVFPEEFQILLCGMLELTSGCLMLREMESTAVRFLLASVMLNFGGLCVLLQTVSVTSGLKIKNYFLGKMMQTGFAFLYACLFLGIWSALIPIGCIFFAKFILIPGKKYSNLLKNSV